jgi:hypothetical protein
MRFLESTIVGVVGFGEKAQISQFQHFDRCSLFLVVCLLGAFAKRRIYQDQAQQNSQGCYIQKNDEEFLILQFPQSSKAKAAIFMRDDKRCQVQSLPCWLQRAHNFSVKSLFHGKLMAYKYE